jgi:DNA-binding NtrC family response regulator
LSALLRIAFRSDALGTGIALPGRERVHDGCAQPDVNTARKMGQTLVPMLWIVHREPGSRVAMARLAGADESVLGAPGDPVFDSSPPPDVVVMGLAGDFEPELQFAHRMGRRLHATSWVLLADPARHDEVRRLFDTLDAQMLRYPPEAAALRRAIRQAPAARGTAPLPLSQRPAHDALSARFNRAFSDLEIPDLLRALDPQLIDVPILIAGESGTGRSLLARYIHAYSEAARGPLAEVACEPETSPTDILSALEVAGREAPGHTTGTVCLYEIDRLSTATQRRVHTWIEFAPPAGGLHTRITRWIGTVRDPEALEPRLRQTLAGLSVAIPPLRERSNAVAQVARAAIEAWCGARGERARQLSDEALVVLEEYPWPGNVRELEAVVAQTLSASIADPIEAADLRCDGAPLLPREPERGGTALPNEWAAPDEFNWYEAALTELDQQPDRPSDEEEGAITLDELETELEELAEGEDDEAIIDLEELADDETLSDGEAEPRDEPEMVSLETIAEEEAEVVEEDEEEAITELEELAHDEEEDNEEEDDEDDFDLELLDEDDEEEEAITEPEPEFEPEPAVPASPPRDERASLERLAGAVAHEVRNPLATIRSFAQLLSERHDDPEFRERFSELVDQDALRIEDVLERLERLAALAPPAFDSVDVAVILQRILNEQRASIRERRLVVLQELDTEHPRAIGDSEQLTFAFEALVSKSLELVPEGGDVYIASKHHPAGLDGRPSMRVLLRLRGPMRKRGELEVAAGREPVAGVSAAENALELSIAEIIVRAHGGALAIDTSDGEETVIVLDLPA